MADAATLTFVFMRAHPADAARVLELAPTSDVVNLFTQVPTRIGGAVLADMEPRLAARALLAMNEERALELLTELGAQPAVVVLRQIEEPARSRLIAGLPTAAALTARLLVQFVDDSVGACVDPNAIAVPLALAAREALERVRLADFRVDRVFVVDEQRRLLGWVPLDTLLRAPAEARLESLLSDPRTARISVHAPLTGARAHPAWRDTSILPVVDRRDRLIGVLTREALEHALQRAVRAAEHPAAEESLPVMLVQGYWQSISGILEALAASLPAARALEHDSHEH